MSVMVCFALPFCLGLADPPKATEFPADEVRKVVAAVVAAAEENAARGPEKLTGDALTDYYIRRAAAAAKAKGVSPRAFLLALGVAVDDSGLLRKNLLTRSYLKKVESDAERSRRLRSIGEPRLRRRHDWVLHFCISAALTAQVGPDAAEQIGITKELLDARLTSGFSFADLAADFAGVLFAKAVLSKAADQPLRRIAESFRGTDFLPDINDLEEGLALQQFLDKYGGVKDPRFRKACDTIRARVARSPGLRLLSERKKPDR
jgi:hypothetical protein